MIDKRPRIIDAVAEAKELVANGRVGLKGWACQSAKAKEVSI